MGELGMIVTIVRGKGTPGKFAIIATIMQRRRSR
jgi:hypothetical protein